MLIGATRCGVICENTVLLDTQRPCGSVRECSADTVTDDTRAQVESVTPATLVVTFPSIKTKNFSVDGGGIRFDIFSSSRFASAGTYTSSQVFEV